MARISRDWFRFNYVDLLVWYSCSSDLNSIDNMLSVMVRDVLNDESQLSNVPELKKAVLDAWANASRKVLENWYL